MKARLLHPDHDVDWRWARQAALAREAQRTGRRVQLQGFDRDAGLPWNHAALTQDLELDTLLQATAGDDDWAFEVSRRVILMACANDLATIRHRRAVLADGLAQPDAVRELYRLAVEGMGKAEKRYLGSLAHYRTTSRATRSS